MACTAIGLALGTVLRGATKAAGVVLLWAVIIQPQLNGISVQVHGTLLGLYDILPVAGINTLVNLYNNVGPGHQPEAALRGASQPRDRVRDLGLYVAVSLVVAALVTNHRDVT